MTSRGGLLTIAGLSGVVGGIIFALGVDLSVPEKSNMKVFSARQEDEPDVMRIYRWGADEIMVKKSQNSSEYIPLRDYLKNFSDEDTRKVEEAKIKGRVKWYSE